MDFTFIILDHLTLFISPNICKILYLYFYVTYVHIHKYIHIHPQPPTHTIDHYLYAGAGPQFLPEENSGFAQPYYFYVSPQLRGGWPAA